MQAREHTALARRRLLNEMPCRFNSGLLGSCVLQRAQTAQHHAGRY
jgi:hypothetical protein